MLRRFVEPSQFRSNAFVRDLNDHQLVGSMGRTSRLLDRIAAHNPAGLLAEAGAAQDRSSSTTEKSQQLVGA